MSGIEERIDGIDKGLGPVGGPRPVRDWVAEGHTLFDGSLSWPVMILREEALAQNVDALARFCREHDLDFAPHGKTTMAPRLYERQLEAGAWGITVASAQQLAVARRADVRRVLVANQILDAGALDAIAADLADDPDFEFACFVDSPEGVEAAAVAGLAHPSRGGFPVLLDVGWAGGRTGVRTAEEGREIAALAAATDGVRLAGVSSYEGGLPTPEAVREYFAVVRAVVEEIGDAGLLGEGAIVSAGGSAYFDLVASELGGAWAARRGVRILLRSGAYVSHDDGVYEGKTAYRRIPEEGHLEAAIEVWAQVLSAPEQGLALVGMGKRDAPYDEGMPVPLRTRRAGTGELVDVRGRAWVPKLDDQHGYVTLEEGLVLRPGDLVCFGISHPCTAFDKWRALPIVDAHDRVVDVVRTYF